jgi:hypothetical protein
MVTDPTYYESFDFIRCSSLIYVAVLKITSLGLFIERWSENMKKKVIEAYL